MDPIPSQNKALPFRDIPEQQKKIYIYYSLTAYNRYLKSHSLLLNLNLLIFFLFFYF